MERFFIQKNRNYTTICNEALRDKRLSLKAKGLYAFIVSLPDTWDYTVAGLVAVLKEGRDAVMNALKELEECGYLERRQQRTKKGQYGGTAYIIFEKSETDVGKSDIGKDETKEQTTFVTKGKKKNYNKKSPHFANERTYSREELNSLIDNVDDIEF